jgi:hypothetical protein
MAKLAALATELPVCVFRACSGFSAVGKNRQIFLSVFAFLKAHSKRHEQRFAIISREKT